ncbi:MAG: metallophosphoesterase family protein [Methanomassiliicoccales archaeon]|nr:metallophosphoesterase family protein [Methanomassiliicoccales archaeon]
MGAKYLVLSDVHRRAWVAERARDLVKEHAMDGVVLLGDITHFGPPQFAEKFIGDLGVKCYVVPGNCDPPGTLAFIEKSAVSLHGRKVQVDGMTWAGLGGSNPTIFQTPFEMPEKDIEKILAPLMEPGMVLVLHCPPHGTWDATYTGQHVGSTAVRNLILRTRPLVVLSGHIHEDRGISHVDGVWYMNPGAAKDHYAGLMELGDGVSLSLLDL